MFAFFWGYIEFLQASFWCIVHKDLLFVKLPSQHSLFSSSPIQMYLFSVPQQSSVLPQKINRRKGSRTEYNVKVKRGRWKFWTELFSVCKHSLRKEGQSMEFSNLWIIISIARLALKKVLTKPYSSMDNKRKLYEVTTTTQ